MSNNDLPPKLRLIREADTAKQESPEQERLDLRELSRQRERAEQERLELWKLSLRERAEQKRLELGELSLQKRVEQKRVEQKRVEQKETRQVSSLEPTLRKIREARKSIQLDLRNEGLTEIPAELFKLTQLKTLYLSSNQLIRIPDAITQLKNLSYLDLFDNQLSELPDAIAQLKNLSFLDLSRNQLSEIPESITQLQNLLELKLSNNQLRKLPDSILQLQNISKLYLVSNQLSEIPESIIQLQSLSVLDLSGNQLSEIPESITQLQNLLELNLSDNPIESPPLEIAQRGIEAIREYFRQQREEGFDYLYEAKLLIIGEGEAGKTTLAKKIQDPNFPLNPSQSRTEGIDVIRYPFLCDGHDFRINIWDFGGQEIYHATHQFFLTKRSLYALVIDNRRENANLDYWLNIVELLSENSPLLIIQNEKKDSRCEVDESAIRGRFTNLKETLSTNFATNRGLDKILQTIKLYIQSLEHVRTALPKTWVKVRTALETDSRNYISLDTYLDICAQNGFKNREDALQLLGYLHDLGVCLHFQDDFLLKKTVILKPHWGTAAVYKALDNPQVLQNQGKFNCADLAQIWHESTYANMQDELLQLMIKFRLCYRIRNTDDYIAPQLLPRNKPVYPWNSTDNFILRYTYDFMPKGILTQCIVALHDLIDQQKYVWRSGVILKQDNTRAEIIESYGQREIRIRFHGADPKPLMVIVTRELENIHRTYKRLKAHKLIPCHCPRCTDSNQDPHFFNFTELRDRRDYGKPTIECAKPPYHEVNVAALLAEVSDRPFAPHTPHPTPQPELFISYAWGGNSEELVNKLDRTFQEKGIPLIRDKRDLDFKGSITEFMQRIGRGKAIIVVISEKYLKSENCMFELVSISQQGKFRDRIFPIVLDDAKIYKSYDRLKYVQHWEAEIAKLDEAMKTVNSANLQGIREDMDLYTQIRAAIAEHTNTLRDMNTLTATIHSESAFEALIAAIEQKLLE